IEEEDSALCFVDPKGFRYYLPAYMVWGLRNYKRSEEFISFSLNHPILSLALSESAGMRRWDLDRFEMFNAEQARAICSFLRCMTRQDELHVMVDEARNALDKYWGRFCQEADPSAGHALDPS